MCLILQTPSPHCVNNPFRGEHPRPHIVPIQVHISSVFGNQEPRGPRFGLPSLSSTAPEEQLARTRTEGGLPSFCEQMNSHSGHCESTCTHNFDVIMRKNFKISISRLQRVLLIVGFFTSSGALPDSQLLRWLHYYN